MRKIAVVDVFFSPEHLEIIRRRAENLGFAVDFYTDGVLPEQRAGEYEVIYGRCPADTLRQAASLKWFCCSFAGVDNYLADNAYPHPGVLLSNSSGAYGPTIAEHIIMVTLMLLRQMPHFQEVVRQRKWLRDGAMRSICGSAITVVGTGDIGTSFARRAKAMDARVVRGVRRSRKPCDPAFDEVYTTAELDDILPQTEILVLALPSTQETVGILSRERIALLPPEAIVVNVGRGTAVDQDALMEALNAGRISGAALDVVVPEPLPPEHPLWDTKNLLLTTHISGNFSLGVTRDLNVELFCRDLENYAAGRPLERLVDRKIGY